MKSPRRRRPVPLELHFGRAGLGLANHVGIKLTAFLTDISGYLIFATALVLTVALLAFAQSWDLARLITFKNYSGDAGGGTWPATQNMWLLFDLGLLLPIYTITGFDASAHTAEETHEWGPGIWVRCSGWWRFWWYS